MLDVSQIQNIAPNQAPRQGTNAALAAIRSLFGQVSQISGGTGGAVFSTVNVPANRFEWTDTGLVLSGTDALIMEAVGAISHSGTVPLYGPYEGLAELRAVLVTDGSTPNGNIAGEVSYRIRRTFNREPGRLWLRIRDVGGNGDNPGSFDVALARYLDSTTAPAPMIHRHSQSEVAGLVDVIANLTARVQALEAR